MSQIETRLVHGNNIKTFLKLRFTFSFLDPQTYVILAGQFQSSSCFIRSSRERTHTHKIFVHKNEQEFLTIWVGMMRQEKNKIAWRSSNVMKLTLPQDSDQQISLNWRNVWIFFFECKVSAVQFLHKIMDSWLQTILLTYKRLLIASVKSELLRTRSV